MRKGFVWIAIITLSAACFIVGAQTVGKSTWDDFQTIESIIKRSEQKAGNLARDIGTLSEIKGMVFMNPDKKKELEKIISVYPDYTMKEFIDRIVKLETLRTYLVDNGYVE